MAMVWDAFPASGSELLAMLAMADWCNDMGGSLFPSMASVAEKIRVSEKQARRIVQSLVDSGFLRVVGNAYGGKPGSTKHFQIEIGKLRALVAAKEKASTTPTHGSPTPPMQGSRTPPTSVTPPMQGIDPSHGCPSTPPTHGSLTTIELLIEPPYTTVRSKTLSESPSAPPPSVVFSEIKKPAKTPKVKTEAVDKQGTELQLACRETWNAYGAAYQARYGTAPVRNAKVSSSVKAFVMRIGKSESPAVAEFFVSRVNDVFVVRKMHDIGLMLNGAEAYRTQWATGQSMTATRAQQADKTQANASVADEAFAILMANRERKSA